MAKKKAKGKVKEKQKGTGKEEPTEKQLLTAQIEGLEQELQMNTEKLKLKKAELEDWKQQWKDEMKQKEACVAYLKRVLQRKTEECHHVQDQLEMEKDLRELIESRISGQYDNAERRREFSRSLFLHQKLELEGKLLLLERQRVAKDSQTANLQKLEEALEAKNTAVREKTREEEIGHVNRLLKNRETFKDLLGDLRAQWKEAFLPVYAKSHLDENVRLRSLCDETTQALLEAQNENRSIRKSEKFLDLEREIQGSSEQRAEHLSAYYEKKFSSLDSRIQKMQQEQSAAIEAKYFELLASEIKEKKSALSTVQDKLKEMKLVLRDQEEYRKTMKHRLDKVTNQNGILVSNILRAEQVLKSRKSLVDDTNSESIDYEILHQIKKFFDFAEQHEKFIDK